MRMSGARTLVTGASGGLGAAIARACAGCGAQVIATGRNERALAALEGAIACETVVADLADANQVRRLLDEVGDVDVLVSNAALPAGGRVETFSTDEIDRAVNVNLRAPMILSRVLIDGM